MKKNILPLLSLMLVSLLFSQTIIFSQITLESSFKHPPEAAKPRVWWHWMNGNVSKEGITADLEWMKRVNIGGFQMFDGNLGTPQFVDKRLVWMTPEWKDALNHAAKEADRLGLEMTMAASGGWSETGGPWVKPAQAMKKVVWSATIINGGQHFSGNLPQPPAVNGLFQNIPRTERRSSFAQAPLPGAKPSAPQPQPKPDPTFYADTKVIAIRLPDGEMSSRDAKPIVTSSAKIDLSPLTDGDLSRPIQIGFADGANENWVQFEFPPPFTAQTLTVAGTGGGQFGFANTIPAGKLQTSNDGANWQDLVDLPGKKHPVSSFPVRTFNFAPITAKFFRVLMIKPPTRPGANQPPPVVNVAEFELTNTPRINYWQDKAQFGNFTDFVSTATPNVPDNQVTKLQNVIDLTNKMRPDGSLDWDAPAGKWQILRMGYSLTGKKNGPASPEATGFEVDKLSKQHVTAYLDHYVGEVSKTTKPYFGKSFRYFLMDSWEAEWENWTDEMIAEFTKRRGYDPTPYLPVLTGRIIESSDVSERFLWDYRRTIADLLTENHYGLATNYLKKFGIGLYAEAPGVDFPTTGDGLQAKGRVTIPMGEFWTMAPGQPHMPNHTADLREAASAAHIYGKPIVASESFTALPSLPAWGQSPYYLKSFGDWAMAQGVNRFVFHTSDQQPFVDEKHKPGMTLGPFGQHYTRNITWAEQAVVWNTYLARCSHLLQQGKFVGDLAYFYGEGAPVAVPFWKPVNPAPPTGYNFDWVNGEILLTQMTVKDGKIILPSGMSYSALILPEDVNQLTLPALKRIRDLITAGGIVIAPRPVKSPTLSGYPNADTEFQTIIKQVWGSIDGQTVTENKIGKGKIYWGKPVADVLAENGTLPDIQFSAAKDADLVWIHRRTPTAEIYFVSNQKQRNEEITASFRVTGKEAELWHADSGETEPADYKIENGRTTVPLKLDPNGSVFVVFRKATTSKSRTLPKPVTSDLATIEGAWNVSFPPNLGAPSAITLDNLTSWTKNTEDGVKYFSGTATYAKDIEVSQTWLNSGKIEIDLGDVREFAELSVNGKPFGVMWKPPFKADVTSALKAGKNRLEIKVTNMWTNRMIGDEQPNAKEHFTFTDYRFFTKDSPLLKSGLLGPVNLVKVKIKK